MLNPQQKQDVRHAVLYAMYHRSTVPMCVSQIAAGIRKLLPFAVTQGDVLEALQFQAGLKNAELVQDPFGAEDMFQITAQGTLAYERDFNKAG